jgi:MinD superfamily P-loop ATPase
MIIAVASGKGGTGKTLVATSLASLWAEQGLTVSYCDADVEEPNGHLFLAPENHTTERFGVPIPTLDGRRCGGHGRCQEVCAFNAILSTDHRVIVFPELCHSCQACVLACPEAFLREQTRPIGTISLGAARDGTIGFVSGELDVGEARAVPLVERVVHLSRKQKAPIIIDAPPGTSCNVKAAIERATLLLLVTEPTPFGLHDLQLTVDLGRALGQPMAAVVNRADIGDDQVRGFLEHEEIPLLAEIPFDWAVAEAYATARPAIDASTGFRQSIADLGAKLLDLGGEQS